MIKRLTILLSVCVCIFFNVKAQSELIRTHREWVKTHYTDPEKMSDQELVSACLDIIRSNLQEPEALKVLDTAEKKIHGLKDYISWKKRHTDDKLYGNTIKALQAISRYAEERNLSPYDKAYAKAILLTAKGNVHDVDEEWENALKGYLAEIGDSPSQQEAGLGCLMKLISKQQQIVRRNYDDPDEYREIFDLEKEALSIYPAKCDSNDKIRAEIYYWLGELKANLHNDFAAGLEHSLSHFNKDTSFVIIGQNSRYPCNSLFYYDNAFDIASRILNEGHPFVRKIKYSRNSFSESNLVSSPTRREDIKKEYDYINEYFPEKSAEVAEARILWSVISARNGMPLDDESLLKTSVDVLERSLGLQNPVFSQYLFQLAGTMLFADPDNDYWYKRFERLLTANGRSIYADPDNMDVYMMTLLTESRHAADPDDTLEKMGVILEEYEDNHSPALLSIITGRLIADYYFNQAFDPVIATNVSFIAMDDCLKYNIIKSGKEVGADYHTIGYDLAQNSPLYWELQTMIMGNSDPTSYELVSNSADVLSLRIDLSDFRGKEFVSSVIRSLRAYRYTEYKKDYETAVSLLHEAVNTLDEQSVDAKVHTLATIAIYLQSGGIENQESMSNILEAIRAIENTSNTAIQPNNFRTISEWYMNEGRYNEALEWCEKALGQYKKIYGDDAFSDDYLTIRRDLALIYEQMGRYSESRRILGEDADFMTEALGVVPTPALLDALWREFNSISSDNLKDINIWMAKLYKIQDITTKLITFSANNPKYIYSYGLRYMSVIVSVISYFWNNEEYNNATSEQKRNLEKTLGDIRRTAYQLEISLGYMKDNVPNYENDGYYLDAVKSLAFYYEKVENQKLRAKELRHIALGDEINQTNYTDYLDYANLLISLGDKDEADSYIESVEKAYQNGELNYLSEMDLNWIDAYRYHRALESNDLQKAYFYTYQVYNRERTFLDTNFKLMTNDEQENYMQTHGDPASPYTNLVEFANFASGSAYNAVIHRTGLKLRSQREFIDIIERSDNPNLRAMLDTVNVLRTAVQSFNTPAPGSSQDEIRAYHSTLSNLRHKMNRIEQKLLAEIEPMRSRSIEDVKYDDIQKKLSEDECSIEFIFSTNHVMALMLTSTSNGPLPIMLCTVDSLTSRLFANGIKNSAARARALYGQNDTELYRMLWEPLEPYLKDVGTVYYTLPGVLSNLAFNAFATPDGQTLFDKYNLVQLTTTGQLVFDYEEKKPESIAMMGDILYDENQKPLSPDSPGARDIDTGFTFDFTYEESDRSADSENGPSNGERALKKTHFRHLPFTALEIEHIATEFGGLSVDSVRRLKATEPRLRSLAENKPDILHLATHGYYISPDKDVNAFPFLKMKGSGNMQRSGIALAGAEKTWTGRADLPDGQDGILTAAEVATLDLKNTGLVALSACETALGDFSFEGVYGLQRGFKQAGVQTLLVSLWSVNDRSTSLFMSEFYRSLRSGETRYKSWRNAVNRVREDYPDPYYWAPFIILDAKKY